MLALPTLETHQLAARICSVLEAASSATDRHTSLTLRSVPCPASRRWQGFGLGKGGDGWVGKAEMNLVGAIPGEGLVWSDGVELDPERLGGICQVK